MKPSILAVEIKPSNLVRFPGHFSVCTMWSGVDRPSSVGFILPEKLALRLARAMEAGVVFTNPKISTDVNGKTYVSSPCAVYSGEMASDLQKLGF